MGRAVNVASVVFRINEETHGLFTNLHDFADLYADWHVNKLSSSPIHSPLGIAGLYGPTPARGIRHNGLQSRIPGVFAKEILVERADIPLCFSGDNAESRTRHRSVHVPTN